MQREPAPSVRRSTTGATRIGSVSFLNAKPLIWGLENDTSVELHLDVPSRLLEGLQDGRFEVALLPVIDYQRMDGLRLITSGGIGSHDQTLTVRIFSRVPIEQVRTLACDTDSHTSVALARVLFAEYFKQMPKMVDRGQPAAASAEAVLLIGDKVVCEEPAGFPHQLDLGVAWKQMTGLPFVFAAWMAVAGAELGDLPARLVESKREGLKHVDEIVQRYGVTRGWPADIARTYLTHHMQYDIGPQQLKAIGLFHKLAKKHGMVEQCRELEVVGWE